jgi:hypothetical protein
VHRGNCAVQRVGCGFLSGLARCNQENQKAIREHKGIVTVVIAIRQHCRCPERCLVARNGCSALWNIAYRSVENKEAICKIKGVETVADAMKRHDKDAEVQHLGCGLLCELSKHKQILLCIAEAGGIEPLR